MMSSPQRHCQANYSADCEWDGSPNRAKTGTGSRFFHALTGGRRPVAAVEVRTANDSNAAIAVMPPTPVNYGSRPQADIEPGGPIRG